MNTNDQTERVLKYLLSHRSDYGFECHLFLKRRVLKTFKRAARIFANRKFSGRVLDLGGGGGEFALVCQENGMEAYNLGIEMGVNFESDPFPFEYDFFDVVCANSVIEHLHNPSFWLDQVYRTLKPSGLFIIVTPHWPYAAKDFFDTYTHVQPYSATSLRMALEVHQFLVCAMVPWLVEKADFFWTMPPHK